MRYALSADELLIEIRDRPTNRLQRLCHTLCKQIDVPGSNVSFLKDFITFKLLKLEKGHSWANLGYAIA